MIIRHIRRQLLKTRAHSTQAAPVEDPKIYCANYLRTHDYESFLTGPFYGQELKHGYYALKSFAVELASIQDSVSNATIGQMRMQFWRDGIKSIMDNRPPRHPIALGLHDLLRDMKLPAYHFKRIIDARDAKLQTSHFMTLDALTSHAEATSSTLLYLLLGMLKVNHDTVLHAASHIGVAQTLTTLLRGLPFHAAHGRMVIPTEITAKHGVVQEEVFRKGGGARGIDEAVFELATLANDHLHTARSMFKETGGKIPPAVMPVFLAGVPVANILRKLEKANFDAFAPELQVRDWKLPWHIYKVYWMGKI
ncbi:hypothetical protein CYLTODRAFT_344004 [Cylindrobasidium torrendii FP15055 ss-10]|uniref:Terpenoid synthase n=1 Tax=Cylindrobasidium torrendii FP15055 ss-10 TaxID=1314674 RepID=A0A0D7BQK9_9AGAR|nr:hypothetical protein CYLTODRAFT_344004 [Cylindrobasidium torrendii FP15055 ss-10]